jgi:transporter family protein
MWILLAVLSAAFLGVYDIFKKYALKDNAVIPVLYLATLSSSIIFITLVIISRTLPSFETSIIYVPQIPPRDLIYILIKSVLVGSSWLLAYYALKHLPITIVTPIRSTGPLWTLIGAMLLFAEQPNVLQWIGVAVAFTFFYLFALSGKYDGIIFTKNLWILLIILATLFGAASGLYDKYLSERYNRMVIQAWFSIFMSLVLLIPLLFIWFPKRKKQVFSWRWAIPFIGILLSVADFFYFYALSDETALVSMISITRRGSVIISFSLGAVLFREKNILRKALLLLGILLGIAFIVLGSLR